MSSRSYFYLVLYCTPAVKFTVFFWSQQIHPLISLVAVWESSGWIVESDPYGWFQWYCRFYQGRRCSDDARQISRWCKSAGPKGKR